MPSLSIVIPAYNEERRLPSSLDSICAYLAAGSRTAEIVVVDDGSVDDTVAQVEEYAQTAPYVRLLKNPGNQGKGYAVRNGMLAAKGDWRLFTDADLSSPIDEFEKLLAAAIGSNAEIAIGSRALDRSLIGVHQPASREWIGRIFNGLMRSVTGLPFRDTQCGFKLYSARAAQEVFSRQQLTGFGFDVEDLYIAQVRRLKTVEVPVRWDNVEGTKVGLVNGLDSFLDPLRVRQMHRRGKYD